MNTAVTMNASDSGPTPSSPLSSANAAKARLTEEQKKKNHIESEKKRREAIRQGFDRLSTLVPGMQGQARSEAIVLAATVEHMRAMLAQREQIAAAATAKGWSNEQIGRYYQLAEMEARQMEGVPLQLNSAGVPVANMHTMPQLQAQIQNAGGQRSLEASTTSPHAPPGPPTTAGSKGGGGVAMPENSVGRSESHSDSPTEAKPRED